MNSPENPSTSAGPPAPVVVFAYNRPDHLAQSLDALARNRLADRTDVFVYADGPKGAGDLAAVAEVGRVLDRAKGQAAFHSMSISRSEVNRGLAASVIDGVTEVLAGYGRVIVVEDDLLCAEGFLEFMNGALDRYADCADVWSVSGYGLPIQMPRGFADDVYFTPRGSSWGYATWRDRWDTVDWTVADYDEFRRSRRARRRFNQGGRDLSPMLDAQMEGRIDSWAIRWCYAQAKSGAVTVYPVRSLVSNIGLDGTGTHSGVAPRYRVTVDHSLAAPRLIDPEPDRRILRRARSFYLSPLQAMRIRVRRTMDAMGRIVQPR